MSRTEPLVPRWVWPLALLALVLQIIAFHDLRRDDAFITFRYGQNLALGRGLVFNVGEKLMGSTSPGHVLMSALLYPIAGKQALPSVMSSFGCVGWTLQAVAIGVLLRGALGPWGAWLVALAVAAGAARSAEFVSMETNLVAALLLWAVVMMRERRWYAVAALAGFASLFRPDMALPSIMLALLCLRDLRAKAWKPGLVFVGIIGPWLAFAQLYFGRVTPQSAITKYHRTHPAEYFRFLYTLAGSLVSDLSVAIWWFPVMWTLAIGGAVVLVKRDKQWFLPLFAALHFAAYLYLRPFEHHWHLYPANLVFVVCALVAVISLFGQASRHRALPWLGLSVAALMTLGYVRNSVTFAGEHATAFWYGSRDTAYKNIGAYLLKHADKSDVIASVEVGTMAYYTDFRMYDWGALITVNPQYRPREPKLGWSVVDMTFLDVFAPGMIPVRRFDEGSFEVDVHSFALLNAAALRVMSAHPGVHPSALQQALRPELETTLATMARELERSGQTVSQYLASAPR